MILLLILTFRTPPHPPLTVPNSPVYSPSDLLQDLQQCFHLRGQRLRICHGFQLQEMWKKFLRPRLGEKINIYRVSSMQNTRKIHQNAKIHNIKCPSVPTHLSPAMTVDCYLLVVAWTKNWHFRKTESSDYLQLSRTHHSTPMSSHVKCKTMSNKIQYSSRPGFSQLWKLL